MGVSEHGGSYCTLQFIAIFMENVMTNDRIFLGTVFAQLSPWRWRLLNMGMDETYELAYFVWMKIRCQLVWCSPGCEGLLVNEKR